MNLSLKNACLLFTLCMSFVTSASQVSPLSSYNSFLKQLFSRQYSQPAPLSAPRHETSVTTTASQDTNTSKTHKIIGGIFVLGATGALAFAYWKHITKKSTSQRVGYTPAFFEESGRMAPIFAYTSDATHPRPSMSPLYQAIAADDESGTVTCLEQEANPNAISNHELGYRPLMETRSVKIAQCLLDYNADPHLTRATNGETVLHLAMKFNRSPEILALFCSIGVDPNQKDASGNSALHNGYPLSQHYYYNNVAVLLYEGASLQSLNKKGKTPLDKKSPEEIVQVLKMDNAVQQLRQNQADQFKQTLQQYVSGDIAPLVISFVGKDIAHWGQETFWPPIEAQLFAPKPVQQKSKRKATNRPYA